MVRNRAQALRPGKAAYSLRPYRVFSANNTYTRFVCLGAVFSFSEPVGQLSHANTLGEYTISPPTSPYTKYRARSKVLTKGFSFRRCAYGLNRLTKSAPVNVLTLLSRRARTPKILNEIVWMY